MGDFFSYFFAKVEKSKVKTAFFNFHKAFPVEHLFFRFVPAYRRQAFVHLLPPNRRTGRLRLREPRLPAGRRRALKTSLTLYESWVGALLFLFKQS
jgi:hypothetical protein